MLRRIINTQTPSKSLEPNSPKEALKLRNGDIIKGTIIKQHPGHEVLVDIRGTKIRAHTMRSLVEGNKYFFQVMKPGVSRTELKILDGNAYGPGSPLRGNFFKSLAGNELRNILNALFKPHMMKGRTAGTIRNMNSLKELFPSIVFNNQHDSEGHWIHRCILGSGMLWENKVLRFLTGDKTGSRKRLIISDLKGLLLSLGNSLLSEERDHEITEAMVSKIRHAILLIEQDQLQNLSGINEGGNWFFFVPQLMDEGLRGAEFSFKKMKKGEGIFFSVLLDFTHLGEIEFHVTLTGSIIEIGIWAETTEKARFVRENLGTLEKALHGLGLTTGPIVCNGREMEEPEGRSSSTVHLII